MFSDLFEKVCVNCFVGIFVVFFNNLGNVVQLCFCFPLNYE